MSAELREPKGTMHADRPIKKRTEDKLGRAGFARSVAAQIQQAPRGESFVLGLVGAWGTGKTSILNLIKEELAGDSSLLFLWFNPWLFSGHQQLVAHFFQEIAAQLRDQGGQELRDIWRGFEGYSRLLRPLRAVPGGEGERQEESREPSVRRQRELLEKALSEAPQRLVIVIDDLDRLVDDEIRDVMRLVRLLADFPNTVYVLSYDQQRVEQAFGEEERGKAYLEKIVQVVHHVPVIRKSDLRRLLGEELDEVLRSAPHLKETEQGYWESVFNHGTFPLFEGLRDVYRYVNALRPTLERVGGEIMVTDVLALEALRVLEPAVLMELAEHRELLEPKQAWNSSSAGDSERRRQSAEKLSALGGRRTSRVRSLIEKLFPTIGGQYGNDWLRTWRRHRRVAAPNVFQIYLESSLPEGVLPARDVHEFVTSFGNPGTLSDYMNSKSPEQLSGLLLCLSDYGTDIPAHEFELTVKALLGQVPRCHEEPSHVMAFSAKGALIELALQMLRKIEPGCRLKTIEEQISRLPELADRWLLIQIMTPSVDQPESVSDQDLKRLASDLAQEFIATPVDRLALERDLVRICDHVTTHGKSKTEARKKIRELIAHDRALVRLLTSGLTYSFSTRSGYEYQLPWWDDMTRIVGFDILKKRVCELDDRRGELALADRDTLALDTALRYAEGWRPTHFGRKAEPDVTEDTAADPDIAASVNKDGPGEEEEPDALT